MRRRRLLRAATALPLLAAPAPALLRSRPARAAEPVDVELVLAVDVSRSVDPEEQEMQMRGYAAAFRDRQLVQGIARGAVGAIACTLFAWSDWDIQEDLVPWMRITDAGSAERFAAALDAASRRTFLYTSISGAMDHALRLFGRGYEGTRRVLDVSGDGVNNSGRPVGQARADALAEGVIINGLAVLDRAAPPGAALFGQPPLDDYYRDEVVGGPGSFLMVAEGFEAFEQAVRRKIVREIALHPAPGPAVEHAFA